MIDRIHDLISAAAAAEPHRVAVVDSDGTSTTFAEFDAQVRALAGWLANRTRRGDRVAVVADNSTDYARLYYAVPASGRILVLVNQRLSADERAAQLETTGPAVIVGDERYLDEYEPSADRIAFEDPQWSRILAESPPADDDVQPDDPAWWLFTSGSTGVPKAVVHTHRSITTAVRGTVTGRSVRSGGAYLLPSSRCATSRGTTCWFTTRRPRPCCPSPHSVRTRSCGP